MARNQTMTRGQFIDLLAEAGANANTIQALFNAYTAGAEHMKAQCLQQVEDCVNIESLYGDIEAIDII